MDFDKNDLYHEIVPFAVDHPLRFPMAYFEVRTVCVHKLVSFVQNRFWSDFPGRTFP